MDESNGRAITVKELAAAQAAASSAPSAMLGPWETIIVSIVAKQCRTKCFQHLKTLFRAYPHPKDMSTAEVAMVANYLYEVPHYERKAKQVVELSQIWVSEKFTDLRDLPGCGVQVVEDVLQCLNTITKIGGSMQ